MCGRISSADDIADNKQPGDMTDQEADLFWKAEFQKAHDEVSLDEYDALLSEVFNRSEDELDIDFNIDDRIFELLDSFSPETWKYMDDSERYTAISEFVSALGEALELDDIPEVAVFDDDDAYGFYFPSDNTINLNRQYFDNPVELVNTIAHEMRHAYQEYRAGLLETREDTLYRVNLDNYISPIPLPGGGLLFFTDYQDQYVEVEPTITPYELHKTAIYRRFCYKGEPVEVTSH